MARYKLLEGQHIQADKTKPILGPDGQPTGRFEKRVYKKDDVVESDTDLVAKLGAGKFQLLDGPEAAQAEKIARLESELARLRSQQGAAAAGGFRTPGDPTPENLQGSPATFPGGQVSTGYQGKAPAAADPEAGHTDEELHGMTVAELRALAEEEEVDLAGARTKEEIVRAIRGAR